MDTQESLKRIADPSEIKGDIEFRDVWFRYPTRKEDFVLKGLSLKINANEKVALVGESGCGKSTLMNLLMRFYDVDSGEVLLDGVNIKEYNLHDLRKAVSLVMQEPVIFNYSILENILYGRLHATNSDIVEASNIANCTEFIENDESLLNDIDESAQSLIKLMNENKAAVEELIGADKFKQEMEVLELLKAQEEMKGTFHNIKGDIDTRD